MLLLKELLLLVKKNKKNYQHFVDKKEKDLILRSFSTIKLNIFACFSVIEELYDPLGNQRHCHVRIWQLPLSFGLQYQSRMHLS